MRIGHITLANRLFAAPMAGVTNAPFRTKFEDDLARMRGSIGIGVISDYEDQPLIIGSHLGTFALATVGVVRNLEELTREAYKLLKAAPIAFVGNIEARNIFSGMADVVVCDGFTGNVALKLSEGKKDV